MTTSYNVPGLSLDYTSGGLDRFGRIIDHAWKKSATDLVRIKHGYDYNGNRLYREDTVALANGKYFDELYTHDGINQVTGMTRGTLNTGKTAIGSNKNNAENFTFDKTGNFSNYKNDTTGNGTFDVNQNRVHSKANEITSIGGSATNVGVDKNGNMTKVTKPDNNSSNYALTYDAWNRVVTVKDGSTTVASYRYNGMNHRVTKSAGSETRLYYYNNEWQCVEEYVGSICDKRYVWGLRYIDDLVMYRVGATDCYSVADPNWNIVAVTNSTGVVQERYTYSAFGKPNFFDAAFVSRSTSTVSNTRLFTGQVFDTETGLMLYRNRYYHPTLGRFVSRDPIGYLANDVNLMRYVGCSPLMRTDPNGERAWSCIVAVACGGVSVTTCAALCATSHWDDINDTFGSCWWKCMKAALGEAPAFDAVCLAAITSCIGRQLTPKPPKQDPLIRHNRNLRFEKLEERIAEEAPFIDCPW